MRPSETNDIIELNVGGFSYATSKSTFLSSPDSMLARLVSGNLPTATDNNGRIFIDRDGPLFRYILNYLRDKRLSLPENFDEYAQLRQEADFYQIDGIIHDIDDLISQQNPSSSLTTSLTSLDSDKNYFKSNKNYHGSYFTVISKLYQGSLESIIGSIRILSVLTSLDLNSKKFLKAINNHSKAKKDSLAYLLDNFVCECKVLPEERILSCKPCGINQSNDVMNTSQTVIRFAKRYNVQTGYWEDMLYLSFESAIPNREQLCSALTGRYNAKLLNSSVCDRRHDEHQTSALVERWYLPDINCFANE
jgi:hypothetical protein